MRVSAVEKILNRKNSAAIEDLLDSMWNSRGLSEPRLQSNTQSMAQKILTQHMVNQTTYIQVDVSRDVDLGKLEGVMNQYTAKQDRQQWMRLGPHANRRS